jgi:hypothetical protein
MGARKLTRWQKASALVPMAVLVGAWGAALTNSSFATASDGTGGGAIPNVPANAFDQPASVQATPGGIDERAGADGTVSTLSTNGIPSAALFAYKRAETLLGKADASCKLPWNLVAAIGRVESNHGRSDGNALNADGIAKPGIYGVLLDGRDGRAKINDTDDGAIDRNAVYDRAVGPMQFIPSTWKAVGVDADNDGMKNPQDIDDAATAAGIYLCAGVGDLSTESGAAAAVQRYNHSTSYVDLVLKISAKYASGDYTQAPNGFSTASVLTNQSNDQTLTPSQRAKAKKAEQKANHKPKPGKGGTGSTGGTGGTGGGTGGTGGTGGGTGGGSTGGSSGGLSGLVGGLVGDVTGGTSGGSGSTGGGSTGSATLTWAEAKAQCLADGLSTLDLLKLTKCITDLLS